MYKVTCLYGGTTYTLHDPLSEDLRIYDDQVETETNAPGSMKFSVPYNHPYLDKIVGLSSDIRVYDGSEEIFRCRPITDGEDLYRSRTFKCEGELAFLYDSIQPRRELHDITPLQFFTLLVEEHNRQVQGGPIDKTFRVGVVTVNDSSNSLYRYILMKYLGIYKFRISVCNVSDNLTISCHGLLQNFGLVCVPFVIIYIDDVRIIVFLIISSLGPYNRQLGLGR